MRQLFLIFTTLFVIGFPVRAEEVPRDRMLRVGLDELAVRDTAYNQKIDVSVTNFSIAELVKGLAIANDLSIDVDFDRKKTITCNLIQQPVKDVLYFICTEKNINVQRCGGGYTHGIYGHDDHTYMAGDWEETDRVKLERL